MQGRAKSFIRDILFDLLHATLQQITHTTPDHTKPTNPRNCGKVHSHQLWANQRFLFGKKKDVQPPGGRETFQKAFQNILHWKPTTFQKRQEKKRFQHQTPFGSPMTVTAVPEIGELAHHYMITVHAEGLAITPIGILIVRSRDWQFGKNSLGRTFVCFFWKDLAKRTLRCNFLLLLFYVSLGEWDFDMSACFCSTVRWR